LGNKRTYCQFQKKKKKKNQTQNKPTNKKTPKNKIQHPKPTTTGRNNPNKTAKKKLAITLRKDRQRQC
jgi:hypothetical protein